MVWSTGNQFRAQGVQVDLVVKVGGEGLDGHGGIVAAPVEAPIHPRLDAATQRRNSAAMAKVAPATARPVSWPSSWPNTITTMA